jgi:hypothetical protein
MKIKLNQKAKCSQCSKNLSEEETDHCEECGKVFCQQCLTYYGENSELAFCESCAK